MKLRELLPIAFGLFVALESWNLEVSNLGTIDDRELTVSEIIVDIGLTQVQVFWRKNFALSASANDERLSP